MNHHMEILTLHKKKKKKQRPTVGRMVFCRLTPLWRWTQTVMWKRRWLRKAGMGKKDPLLVPHMKRPPRVVPLCRPSLHPALPLAPSLGQSPVWVRTLSLCRRLVRGPAPCPHPAPGPSQTMTGPIILRSAQQSASTQECRLLKVFTLIHTDYYAHSSFRYCFMCKFNAGFYPESKTTQTLLS